MNLADVPDAVWGALVGVAGTLIAFGLGRWAKRTDNRDARAAQIETEHRTHNTTIDEEVRRAALEIIAWDIERNNRVTGGGADELSRPPPQEAATLSSHASQRMADAIEAEQRLWSSSTDRDREENEFIDRLLDVRRELVDAARHEVANVGKRVDS
jgi:hypothetical protein